MSKTQLVLFISNKQYCLPFSGELKLVGNNGKPLICGIFIFESKFRGAPYIHKYLVVWKLCDFNTSNLFAEVMIWMLLNV